MRKCDQEMIPWCFAMDKINYARYLPVYSAQMSRLQETSPVLHDHFLNCGFSVQLRNEHPFARIAVDQTTEETVNKDTQTAGGTHGFSLKHGAVSRYYLTAGQRSGALRQLRQDISVQGSVITKHTDLEKTRIKKEESDVASMIDLLESNWTNPFGNDSSDLVSISTGTVASPDVSTDLLAAREKGELAYKEFEQQRIQKGDCFHDPIKKIKLKTFTAMNSKPAKGKTKEIVMKADECCLATWSSLLKAESWKCATSCLILSDLYHGHYHMGMVQWRKQTRLYCQNILRAKCCQ